MSSELQQIGVLGGHSEIPRGVVPWSEPEKHDLGTIYSQMRAEELIKSGAVTRIIDPIVEIAVAKFKYEHPESKGDEGAEAEYVEDVVAQGESYGTWVYFPYSGIFARYAEKDMHRKLRTSRFRDLIAEDEQARLFDKSVMFNGLSVGSKALEACVENGIGGTVILADFDTIDDTNTGRISANHLAVGETKLSHFAKKVSEKDPWIKQIHLPDGVTPESLRRLGETPDLIVEEVDSLAAKALIRLWAQKRGIPLIMAADIHDKTVVDVERYDDQHDRHAAPFLGRIKPEDVQRISEGGLSPEENTKWMLKHTGIRDLSVRMMRSAMEIGERIGGIPQLGTTTSIGGAELAFAAREILLGNKLPSGRYRSTPRDTFRLGNEYGLGETVRTLRDLKSHMERTKDQAAE